jgi:hypothetical protein
MLFDGDRIMIMIQSQVKQDVNTNFFNRKFNLLGGPESGLACFSNVNRYIPSPYGIA